MPSRTRKAFLIFVAVLALAALSAVFPASALAQCPLCRSALDHGGETTARTMNLAIVVLLIPSVSIFCTIFVVAYKKIKTDDEEEQNRGQQDEEQNHGR
jgi:hypothetical protein